MNPRIIVVRVSGYGQTGPYAHRPGYGTVAEAFSGLPAFTGFPDGPPTLSAFPLADTVAATFGLIGLLGAVYERDVAGSGKGQEVDVSLYEPLFRLAESQVIGYAELGLVKERLGNRIAEDSPRNAYATSDGGWIAISASSDRTFRALPWRSAGPSSRTIRASATTRAGSRTTPSSTGSSPTGCASERRPR